MKHLVFHQIAEIPYVHKYFFLQAECLNLYNYSLKNLLPNLDLCLESHVPQTHQMKKRKEVLQALLLL